MTNETFAEQLRVKMAANWANSNILEVPSWQRLNVDINAISESARSAILADSPKTTTVLVGMFNQKGTEVLQFSANAGSPDGFPIVYVAL